jgi:hypothetical protein
VAWLSHQVATADGSAMFTIVPSNTIINCASARTAKTHQRRATAESSTRTVDQGAGNPAR